MFNVFRGTSGLVVVNFPEKKHYVTLEWRLTDNLADTCIVCQVKVTDNLGVCYL